MDSIKAFITKYFFTFTYFYKKLKYRLFIRIGLNITVGALDGFGLAMFLPLLQMAGNSSSENSSDSLGKLGFLVDFITDVGIEFNLFNILCIMTFFFFLKGIAAYINSIYSVKLKQYFIRTMRINLSHHMAKMSYKNFVTSDAGRIQNTLTGELGRMSNAYENYFGAFQQLILTVVYMVFAFTVDAQFALLIGVGGILTNFIFKFLYASTKKASSKITKGSNQYQKLIIQFVTNFKYLKATGKINVYTEKLKEAIHYIENYNFKIGKLSSIITSIREPVLILIVSVVILVEVNYLGGSLGVILISLLFFYKAMNALMFMQTAYNKFLEVSGSMDNMTAFENELVEATEPKGKIKFSTFNNTILIDGASFSYDEQLILNNISLTVTKNDTVAFVGESGSGKSTLVNIIAGLMPLNTGRIQVDNIDYNQLNKNTFQSRIGYITQEPVIFSDTIFNNITFWDDENPETLERFRLALKQASILDFVNELEFGKDTELGNNGVNLSGGQRQRISIARELYKDIDILIMDEATSALDSETEKAIQKSIESLQGSYTILIVAHRLATIKNADRIVLMDKGAVVESGSYQELIATSTRFRHMTSLQQV